jgi:acyl-CoA dehydrogenase
VELVSYAYGTNHFDEDPDLRAVLGQSWPSWRDHEADLRSFGAFAGSEAYEVGFHVDHGAVPVLVAHDLDGTRVDRVRLSPAQAALLPRLWRMNRPPFEGGSWQHHFALGYLLADPGLYCLVVITAQTAFALRKYAPRLASAERALVAGDAVGATWMTESQGGSDLGANATVARRDGGRWRLRGEKYFASGAGLADMALVSARPEGAPAGPKGLALFLVPRLAEDGSLNFFVRRLKDKSATRAVPSGEVELLDAEAQLVGEADQGIYYVLETLTVARVANAVAAMGIARKAHLEALGRTRRRRAFGAVLEDQPLVRLDLTDLAVRTAMGTALAFHAAAAFDLVADERPPYGPDYHHARLLAHLAKARTAEHASAATASAMELFGGLGFLEEYAVARWHREALITPIWEGPANVQALDLLEVLQRKAAHEPFLEGLAGLARAAEGPEGPLARKVAEDAVKELLAARGAEAQWIAKAALRRLADATGVVLLAKLAGTGGARYAKLAALAAQRFLAGEEYPAWAASDREVWDPLGPDRGAPLA